jgi:DNA-binding transcriptional LysR family regulator
MLCDGEIHFALSSYHEESCRDVEFLQFMSESVHLVAPMGHPWAGRGEIELQELFEADFIFREEDSGTFKAVEEAFSKSNIDLNELHTLLVLGNSEAIALAVQEGIGVGFVSKVVVELLGKDRVVPIKVKDLDIYRHISIGRHIGHPASKAQEAFWNFITGLPIPIDHRQPLEALFSETIIQK